MVSATPPERSWRISTRFGDGHPDAGIEYLTDLAAGHHVRSLADLLPKLKPGASVTIACLENGDET